MNARETTEGYFSTFVLDEQVYFGGDGLTAVGFRDAYNLYKLAPTLSWKVMFKQLHRYTWDKKKRAN